MFQKYRIAEIVKLGKIVQVDGGSRSMTKDVSWKGRTEDGPLRLVERFGGRSMPSVWNWFFSGVKSSTNASPKQKSAKARPGLESLETRQVLSAAGIGGLHPFVTLSGQINAPGRPAIIEFQIQPTTAVSDKAIPIILGLKAVSTGGSTVTPVITRIRPLSGGTNQAIFTKGGVVFESASIPLAGPATYAVRVKGVGGTTGQFQVAVFLPGDVNGDGRVDRVDIGLIRSTYGSRAGGPRYNGAADFAQTGKVGLADLGIARRNLGSTLSIVAVNQLTRGFGGSPGAAFDGESSSPLDETAENGKIHRHKGVSERE